MGGGEQYVHGAKGQGLGPGGGSPSASRVRVNKTGVAVTVPRRLGKSEVGSWEGEEKRMDRWRREPEQMEGRATP